ncbi:hypothetical protein KFL_001830250 [Klebsormidium nitens]|uniref:Uncharacterized protein n=1 Tax=Klebsormidium nitens TaxID=105231 RepID=A0A1Y1I4E3_KLENI|nr:hypothetical protein KFL_001830250 [Klebsormidium nitens]|eukprot:GAQ84299.1 hypothetical protein KFL_001830250 [Klebsormidium nitens]
MSAVARGIRVGLSGLRCAPTRLGGSIQNSPTGRWALPRSRIRLSAPLKYRVRWSRRIAAPPPNPCLALPRRHESVLPTQFESVTFKGTQTKRSRPKVASPQQYASTSCASDSETHRKTKRETSVLLPGLPLFGNALDDPSGPGNGVDSLVGGAWLEFFRPCGCWLERACLCIIPAGPVRDLPLNGDDEDENLGDALPLGETVITCATHGDLAPYACCATGA